MIVSRTAQLAALLLSVITSLYLAALMSMGADTHIQLVDMLQWQGSTAGTRFQRGYTLAMILLTASSLLRCKSSRLPRLVRLLILSLGSLCGLATILPVAYSAVTLWQPGFYEHYVGELITILAIGLAMLSSRQRVDSALSTT